MGRRSLTLAEHLAQIKANLAIAANPMQDQVQQTHQKTARTCSKKGKPLSLQQKKELVNSRWLQHFGILKPTRKQDVLPPADRYPFYKTEASRRRQSARAHMKYVEQKERE
jgi:hypothetical protein